MSNPSHFSRRDLMTAAAGLALVNHGVADEKIPGTQVSDRTSSIRITAMKTYWVGPVVYLKIETNHGISGWGDLKGVDPRVSKPLAESLFELLDGENPTRVEHLWQKIFRAHRNMRGGALMVHTLAAIDMALWDITGKLWQVPVYRLLGGPTRDRIRVYHTPKAQKVPPHGIYEHSGNPSDIDNMVKAIKAAREKVGPDGAVMFDAHSAVPPATLIQLAAKLEPYDLLFIEEPAVPGNIETFKRLKQHINIPLATGERDRTIWGMLPYLQEGGIDILQPDCCHTGGISQMKKIAVLAYAPFGRTSLFRRAAGKELPAFAKEFDATTWAQFFLKFTLTHPAITAVTPATSQAKNMLDNIGGGMGRLPTAVHRKQIIEFVDALPQLPGR